MLLPSINSLYVLLYVLIYSITIQSFYFNIKKFHSFNRLYNQPKQLVIKPQLSPISPRIKRLKDKLIEKLIITDLTTAEFALNVNIQSNDKKIDYFKLIQKLNNNLNLLNDKKSINNHNILIDRLLKTKEDLLLVINNQPPKNLHNIILSNLTSNKINDKNDKVERNIEKANLIKELRESLILVREDGTVDWDNAIASSQTVARLGRELFERLNGKEEKIESLNDLFTQIQVQIPTTDTIIFLSNKLNQAIESLDGIKQARDSLKQIIRSDRKNNKLLNENDIVTLRRLDTRVKELTKWVQVLQLDFDIEKICIYIEQEIDSSIDPNEQRTFVAEIALVDKQFSGLVSTLLTNNQSNFLSIDSNINLSTDPITQFESQSVTEDEFISLIDDDELNIIIGEVNDLKNRLGLDTQSAKYDWGSLGVLVSENLAKLKTGVRFYGDGFKLLFKDVLYAWTVLIRAAQGATLKPREVNAIRRTGKDLLTLIPCTIILIIPLTPVGHVLAFSLIQRFFPDFFPSFFTEKRLNLKKLFNEIESKGNSELLDDILGQEKDDNSMNGFLVFGKDILDSIVNTIKGFLVAISNEINAINNNTNTNTSSNTNNDLNSPSISSLVELNSNIANNSVSSKEIVSSKRD